MMPQIIFVKVFMLHIEFIRRKETDILTNSKASFHS